MSEITDTKPTDGNPHPGTALAQAMRAQGISANKLALGLRVPSGRITSILNGKRGISPETALRLARYFSTSEEYWMNLQSRYELAEVRTRFGRRIAEEVPEGGALDPDTLDDADLDVNAREGRVTGLSRIGFVYAQRGNLDAAESHYRMLVDMNRYLYNEASMATDLANLGDIYAQQGKHDEARQEWEKSLALYEKNGETENAGVVREWLAKLERR